MKSKPKLLCYRGELLKDALKQERIVESEILQSLCSKGYSSLNDVDAVVLETNGNISVISRIDTGSRSVLKDVS